MIEAKFDVFCVGPDDVVAADDVTTGESKTSFRSQLIVALS